MPNRTLIALSLALAMQLAVPAASARDQAAVSLTGEVMVERSVERDGTRTTVLEPPAQVVPGDRLVYSTRYRNTSAEPVEDFVVTNPLPSAVTLAADGAFEVSVDGGRTFGPLASLSLTLEDGATRPAGLTDVTHVRWTIAHLAPSEEGTLSYSAVVR